MCALTPILKDEPTRVRTDARRPRVQGKSLWLGERKLDVRGVTYGTFRPAADGTPFPDRGLVDEDFATMAAAGVNAVRTYTPPPEWLLDLAADRGLLVLAGLPWEQHVAFLERRSSARSIEARVREQARALAGHPALLGLAVGNEIPAPIARWHGRHRIEAFIERLYTATKEVEPEALVTYVNYPTTEYLQLPFLDFAAFNVYLEEREKLASYLARLHRLVGDRPLLMAELGLDSRRNGEVAQAETLGWQLDTTFEAGCAGAFVFAWTDEWHRGGHDVDDWDFGLVDRARHPKPALAAVSRAFREPAHRRERAWPRVSVVVCTYNGARWLPGCFDALRRVDYPDWEVVVVSDGSTDATDDLVREQGFRLVRAELNGGLSAARNLGMQAASGEILAYLDDDARPDPDWLRFLVLAFERGGHAAAGGPNLPPPTDGTVAQSVARSPGGPIHVLLSDDVAEHIPGCNLAVRRDVLQELGGFDPMFRIAGDDVDLCWRLQDAGHTIGFHPAAVVWHHRRPSVRAYLRQQRLYGHAEGLLHRKWPERYNRLGHLTWAAGIYQACRPRRSSRRDRVSYGSWGSHLFQSIYSRADGLVGCLPVLPEWYLTLMVLAVVGALGLHWPPLLATLPVLVAGCAGIVGAAVSATRAGAEGWRHHGGRRRRVLWLLTFVLHVLQPLVRLAGRLRAGLSPWRRRCRPLPAVPAPRQMTVWSETWAPVESWLSELEHALRRRCHEVTRGSAYDRWDLQVRGGPFGVVRVLSAIEEHGGGKQLVRYRLSPRPSRAVAPVATALAAIAAAAADDGAWIAAALFAVAALAAIATAVHDTAAASGTTKWAIEQQAERAAEAAKQRADWARLPPANGRPVHVPVMSAATRFNLRAPADRRGDTAIVGADGHGSEGSG